MYVRMYVCMYVCRGKKTALEAWKSYLDVSSRCVEHLERFVVLIYDRTSGKTSGSDARKQPFAQKGRALDAIPPTN